MKQTVFKQLLLLAVFLFAGIGSAFGQDENYFHVEVNRVDAAENAYPEVFNQVQVVFESEELCVNVPKEADFPKGNNYKLRIDNFSPDIYTVTSIEINGTPYEDPGKYVNSEYYIEISEPFDDLTIIVTISKVETKTITVHRNSSLSDIAIYCKDNDDEYYDLCISPMTSDEEKVEFEVLPRSSCQLEINPRNSLAYTVRSVIVGDAEATEEFNNDGHVIIPSIDDDIEVFVDVAKIGDTKNISLSIMPDKYGRARGYDPSRDVWSDLEKGAELLVGSTTQMTIETDLGWKVKTLKVDGTDVTETYNSQGYYEFKDLDADHSVAVELGTAKTYTITVDRDRIPDDISLWAYFPNWGSVAFGEAKEFNEGSFVTLEVPAFVRNEDNKQFKVKILDGDTDVTPDSPNDWNEYNYTISNLSSNHVISLDYEIMPSVTVNCICNGEDYNGKLDFYLNDVYYRPGRPCQFAKGTDVTFSLRWIPEGKVVESIKIDDNDITSSFNGTYILSNLTEDHVITVTLSDAEETYQLCAYFYDSSAGTIYFKPAMAEKTESNCLQYPKESVVTLIVKAPIGHEVSKIHLSMSEVRNENGEVVSSRREEDAEIHYNPATKEYYCDITITARTEAGITTQKKPSDGTTEIAYTLDASGMATFCSEYDLDFSTEATKDIAAYVAIGYNSETKKVTMLRVTEVQSGTGLLIVGKPGSYTIPVKATSRNYNNMLTAVGEETTLSETNCYDICYDNYLLSGSVFTKADWTPIPAYQAYLKLAQIMAHTPESVSLEFIDMGDMNGDAKITITDAVMIVDKILNEQ